MDTQKDNVIKDSLSLSDSKERLSRFISLKAEKLTSALYLVTDFLSDSEPLKWKLRSRSIDLLLEAGAVSRRVMSYGRTGGAEAFASLVSDLVFLLEVADKTGSVSEINFSILKQEYLDLKDLLAGTESVRSIKDLFSIGDLSRPNLPIIAPAPIERKESVPSVSVTQEVFVKRQTLANTPSLKKESSIKDNKVYNNGQKDSRRETILKFVKGRGWIGIADIAAVIPDCSTKTIQRELADMVQSGVLNKQGEKRWSRYSLS